MISNATVRIEDCEVIRDTGKAILVRIGDEHEKWIPQSVVSDDSEIWAEGDKGDLVIKAWFAEKEKLDEL
jgi:hypothetical protein